MDTILTTTMPLYPINEHHSAHIVNKLGASNPETFPTIHIAQLECQVFCGQEKYVYLSCRI